MQNNYCHPDATMNILLCVLILLWSCILLWTNPFLLFYFSWVSQGLARLPRAHNFIFKTFCGVPRVHRRFITPLLLWIPDWHFSSSPTVASLDTQLAFLFKTSSWCPSSSQAVYHATTLVDTRLAFLFKTSLWRPSSSQAVYHATTLVDTRLAFLFKTSSWRPSSSQAVCHATTLVDTRLAFLFKTYRGVTWHPTGISFILFYFNFPCLSLTFLYIHLIVHANMLSCHDLIPVNMHLL